MRTGDREDDGGGGGPLPLTVSVQILYITHVIPGNVKLFVSFLKLYCLKSYICPPPPLTSSILPLVILTSFLQTRNLRHRHKVTNGLRIGIQGYMSLNLSFLHTPLSFCFSVRTKCVSSDTEKKQALSASLYQPVSCLIAGRI